MSNLTRAYAPENPMDMLTEQHQKLQQEVGTTIDQARTSLDFIRNHPGWFGKKVLTEARAGFKYGLNCQQIF